MTLAATPSLLFRLKSIRRYIFLCPPPRNRTVMTPWLFRPPFFGRGTNSDFSGLLARGKVHSAKSETEPPRRPAEVGLYKRMPMSASFQSHGSHGSRQSHRVC